MIQSSKLDAFNGELQKAQAEADVIDAELARLQRDDPAAPFRFFNLVGRRRLIGERLLAAVEALGSVRADDLSFKTRNPSARAGA